MVLLQGPDLDSRPGCDACAQLRVEILQLEEAGPSTPDLAVMLTLCTARRQVEMMQLEVDDLQAVAISAREAAHAGQAAVLEVDRLAQDNALLAARLTQMNIDLQVLSRNLAGSLFQHAILFPSPTCHSLQHPCCSM